jgi:signal peptidase I
MLPTLEVGDHLFATKLELLWSHPRRGDVIVFRYPRDRSKDYIKRVIAIAGDTVRVEGRAVYLNGAELPHEAAGEYDYDDETVTRHSSRVVEQIPSDPPRRYSVIYGNDNAGAPTFPSGGELPGIECGPSECRVQPGYVFVLGDNRDSSFDRRAFGAVPLGLVKGRATLLWWSRAPGSGVRWNRIAKSVE